MVPLPPVRTAPAIFFSRSESILQENRMRLRTLQQACRAAPITSCCLSEGNPVAWTDVLQATHSAPGPRPARGYREHS